jgi:hypothetical protein
MALDDRCMKCRRTRLELNKKDIELRRHGNYRAIKYLCDDCIFTKTLG